MNTRENVRLLLSLVGLNVIPHLFNVSSWVAALSIILWLWRWGQVDGRLPEISRRVISGFVVAMVVTVVVTHQNLWGQEAATDLLVLMAVAKTYEVRIYKDVMVLAYLCFYLLMAKALDSQSVIITIFLVIDVFLIVSVIAYIHSAQERRQITRIFRQALTLSFLGLPLAVILFIIFPRFSTGLGAFMGQQKGRSGISDKLSPGELSELVLSDAVIFRASVDRHKVNQGDLYWRGTVLDESSGLDWRRRKQDQKVITKRPLVGEEWVRQDIIVEPSQDRWIYGLEYAGRVSVPGLGSYSKLMYDNRGYYFLNHQLYSKLQYTIWSNTKSEDIVGNADSGDVKVNLDEHQLGHIRNWLNSMNLSKLSPVAKVNRLLKFFQQERFEYTLKPGAMMSMDEFLFERKQGFCEHYAATMATLLRLLDVPSRVVVGFQGGTPSLSGDYVIVRGLDAHAWVEYWDRSQWNRVDPISVVAPARIELGTLAYEDYMRERQVEALTNDSSKWVYDVERLAKKLYFNTVLVWDQVDAFWINFLLSFDIKYQKELLKQLVGFRLSPWQLFIITLLLITLLAVRLYVKFYLSNSLSNGAQLYQLFCRRMKKMGVEKSCTEGPLDFGVRLSQAFPEREKELFEILGPIINAQYGNEPMARSLQNRLIWRILRFNGRSLQR